MRETFIEKKFTAASLRLIEQANAIIDEYQAQRFRLTLRQLYYQFVARDLVPNRLREYKRLGSVINDARLAGLIDWDAIEDRTRFVRSQPTWSDPSGIIESASLQYAIDLWEGQPFRPEVWIEKDALVGIIERVCTRYQTPYFACRGYTSQSAQYEASKRLLLYQKNGQRPVIFHLGDHDPSGLDMTRDNQDRLNLFVQLAGLADVRRLALNFDQVERYRPPPNPAKETDSRSRSYIDEFGQESWELDALDPRVISDLIERNVRRLLNRSRWEASQQRMENEKAILRQCSENWERVTEFLQQ